MRINHNIAALNTYRQLSTNSTAGSKSLEKLSSGQRINRAGDDAAGLAISEKMRGQIRGLSQAQRNAQDGISMIQTAEGGLNETHSILQRMRELSVQASNETLQSTDRTAIGEELVALKDEINRISTTTKFNGNSLLNGALTTSLNTTTSTTKVGASIGTGLIISEVNVRNAKAGLTYRIVSGTVANTIRLSGSDGSSSSTVTLGAAAVGTNSINFEDVGVSISFVASQTHTAAQLVTGLVSGNITTSGNGAASFLIGANAGEAMSLSFANMNASSIGNNISNGCGSAGCVSTTSKANTLITSIDLAIVHVSTQRAKLGAAQNRLEHTINNLSTSEENLTASESRIRDVDMAKEMMEYTKVNILTQAAQSMLAQANQQPQGVLQLLR